MPSFRKREVAPRIDERNKGRHHWHSGFDTYQVDLWRWRLEVRFLFGIPSLAYGVAKRAGMRTVQCSDDCGAQRLLLRVRHDHGGPGNRLQRDPMQSDRAAKRANRRDPPDTTKHDGKTSGRPGSSQQGYVCLKHKSNFLKFAGAEFTETEGALDAIKRVTSN
jgi:hypothetical protein